MIYPAVTRLRPRSAAGYGDADALNDIHALLTTSPDPASDQLGDIGVILARTGRPLIPVRPIEITIAETPDGRPVARTISADTTVTVRQEPAGNALRVEITTEQAGDSDAVAITLNGRCLHHPSPPNGHTA
jgi:hypothetical protein